MSWKRAAEEKIMASPEFQKEYEEWDKSLEEE